MKDWNRTGKIKAILLAVFSLPNLLIPIGANPHQGFVLILMPFLFGSVMIPLISIVNKAVLGRAITKPHWNDNPLTRKRPLSSFHFGAYFFLSIGLSIVIGTAIRFQTFSQLGLTSVSFGLGILIGIYLSLKWINKKD